MLKITEEQALEVLGGTPPDYDTYYAHQALYGLGFVIRNKTGLYLCSNTEAMNLLLNGYCPNKTKMN